MYFYLIISSIFPGAGGITRALFQLKSLNLIFLKNQCFLLLIKQNIKGGVLENAENFVTDHLKLQNTLDENCSDSIHSPIIKDLIEEFS